MIGLCGGVKHCYVTETLLDMSNDNKQGACPCSTENLSEKNSVECQNFKPRRKVLFPEDDDDLVTKYFEPANPWKHKTNLTRDMLVSEYIESCKTHQALPIHTIIAQIEELSEHVLSGQNRAPRFCLSECSVYGSRSIDALEALLRRVQYRRFEIHDTVLDDEGAEALFDMIEYYESANIINITGGREFGIRGWQACSRMIKMSAELSELEIRDIQLDIENVPVLARALRPHTCCLRSLCLTRARLAGPALTCLVKVLKINNSVRELKLGDNELNVEDAKQLASLLEINTRIQLLDLSNNYIRDNGVQYLTAAITSQSAPTPPSGTASPLSPVYSPFGETRGLAFLVLWNNQLTWNCAQYISDALKSSSSLCVLNIGRNILGAEAMRCISIGAAQGSLQSLGLQAARLGAEAAVSIAYLLKHCMHLQRLDLRDNKLGEAGLEIILAALKQNTTLTQIDLDDAAESTTLTVDGNESAERVRLTREIRALCRKNEPTASEHRPHRKISLTCHSVFNMRSPPEDSRRGRLKSPAPSPTPSPAGSPVPSNHSRFSVTRVTPDRESSTDSSSPSTPTRFSPSRFRVVQVADPPQITVQPVKADAPKPSRFSVSRNYDSVYSIKPAIVKNDSVIVKNTSDKDVISNSAVKTNDKSDVKDASDVTSSVNSDAKDNVVIDARDEEVTNENDEPKYQDKSEEVSFNESLKEDGGNKVHVSETKLLKNSTESNSKEKLDVKVEITVTKETVEDGKRQNKKTSEKGCLDFKNLDDISIRKAVDNTIKKIEAVITTDLDNIIQEMGDLSTKTHMLLSKKTDSIDKLKELTQEAKKPNSVVLKKNKSESSLDSPDLEVSSLMKADKPFCDSNSSFSCSSIESLTHTDAKTETELDRRKVIPISTDDSLELTQVQLNTPLSSAESVSPIFSKHLKVHGSLSSLEASVSSLDSVKDKIMFTSADSGIEYSLQHQDFSSNEGTLTHNSLDEKVCESVQETLTNSPKLERKDRVRKVNIVASSSFKEPEIQKESKLPSHLEKLLSLFQHPSALFSRTTLDEEKRSGTPPRKESATVASSFWSWGHANERSDESSPEYGSDSTLSERVQVSFVDDTFSKKLDSKTPSSDADTDTLSEFQPYPTTEVQTVAVSHCDKADLINEHCDNDKEVTRPRSFASVLKTTSNSMEKPPSPINQTTEKLSNKMKQGIKENISPENTLTVNLFEQEMGQRKEKIDNVDLAKDALTLLSEANDYEPKDLLQVDDMERNLAEELRKAELDIDLSPELIVEEHSNTTDIFNDLRTSPLIPERAKIKSNSMEDLSQRLKAIEDVELPRKSKIVFKIPETRTRPREIPESKFRLRTRSGSSPKSLPESLIKSPIAKECCKKKRKVSSLGKMARDSLLALNLSEEELVQFRRSYKLSVESLKSLESVSEDANSQSGTSMCKLCCGTSQESLISLDSINEDCHCEHAGSSR